MMKVDVRLNRLNHGRPLSIAINADKTGACLYLDDPTFDAIGCPQTALDLQAVRELRNAFMRLEVAMMNGTIPGAELSLDIPNILDFAGARTHV